MKKSLKTILVIFSFLLFINTVEALSIVRTPEWQEQITTDGSDISLYSSYTKLPSLNLSVPKVIEVDFDASAIKQRAFAVFDEKSQIIVPSIFVIKNSANPIISSIKESNTSEDLYSLHDSNIMTKKDFYLKSNSQSSVSLVIDYTYPIKAYMFGMSLDKNVSLPDLVTVRAFVNNNWITVINRSKLSGYSLAFPETTAQKWMVTIEYSQPIRITDIQFVNTNTSIDKIGVRFLAQPNTSYTVYTNPDRIIRQNNSSDTFHLNTTDYKNIGLQSLSNNPNFLPSDLDKDGIIDIMDNCKSNPNPNQNDENGNGVGDICDDYDNDRLPNYVDNCPNLPNYDQRDTDGDKIGDKCDPDESRFTEKYPIIVWFGLGLSSLIFLSLLYVAGMKMRNNLDNQGGQNNLN